MKHNFKTLQQICNSFKVKSKALQNIPCPNCNLIFHHFPPFLLFSNTGFLAIPLTSSTCNSHKAFVLASRFLDLSLSLALGKSLARLPSSEDFLNKQEVPNSLSNLFVTLFLVIMFISTWHIFVCLLTLEKRSFFYFIHWIDQCLLYSIGSTNTY